MAPSMVLVYFVYGLAFFSMGLALLLESGRSPLLASGRVLRPLAVFGLVHGIHEWYEMFLQAGDSLGQPATTEMILMRLAILVISFTALIAFGLRVLRPQPAWSLRQMTLGAGLVGLYPVLYLLSGGLSGEMANAAWLVSADVLARYTLAIPGAALAAIALHRQAAGAQSEGRTAVARYLWVAAICFALYSATQAFVPASSIFPSNWLNAGLFLSLAGIPIQVVRALLAIGITVSLIHATQAVESERQRQFLEVQQSRLEALEQVRKDLIEREEMRKQLLRHVVIAQEDERARIARELHDETAQTLTAFSLHLATLRDSLPEAHLAGPSLAHLQELSRQMSQGIYRLVRDLRPAQLDDLGLVPALQYLAEEECRRVGLQVSMQVHGTRRRLDPLVETVLFRIAQEALTNAARYAGVQDAGLELFFKPDEVVLRVRDQGVGFDPDARLQPPHGWGLEGMRERAESIGARLQLWSAPGQGSLVEVVIACPEMVQSRDVEE